METHAHHLHKTPGSGWLHYLFEFFMLFLAITLGFFVENWRDHYVENKRERQFIITLGEDLKSDTAQLTTDILRGQSRETMIDSLIVLLALPARSNYGAQIYYYARNISRPVLYDQQLRNLQFAFDDENRMRDGLRDKAGKIFDGTVFNQMFDNRDSLPFTIYKKPQGNPALISQNPEYINDYISVAQYLKGPVRIIRLREENLKEEAIKLILLQRRNIG